MMYCTYCGSARHTEVNCPHTSRGSANRMRLRCTYCGARNHEIKACPKTWGGNAARAWNPNSVSDHFVKD